MFDFTLPSNLMSLHLHAEFRSDDLRKVDFFGWGLSALAVSNSMKIFLILYAQKTGASN